MAIVCIYIYMYECNCPRFTISSLFSVLTGLGLRSGSWPAGFMFRCRSRLHLALWSAGLSLSGVHEGSRSVGGRIQRVDPTEASKTEARSSAAIGAGKWLTCQVLWKWFGEKGTLFDESRPLTSSKKEHWAGTDFQRHWLQFFESFLRPQGCVHPGWRKCCAGSEDSNGTPQKLHHESWSTGGTQFSHLRWPKTQNWLSRSGPWGKIQFECSESAPCWIRCCSLGLEGSQLWRILRVRFRK